MHYCLLRTCILMIVIVIVSHLLTVFKIMKTLFLQQLINILISFVGKEVSAGMLLMKIHKPVNKVQLKSIQGERES